MSLQVGDTVRLVEEGQNDLLDGLFAITGAQHLHGTEQKVAGFVNDGGRAEGLPYAIIEGYEHMGEFPLDPQYIQTTEEVAA